MAAATERGGKPLVVAPLRAALSSGSVWLEDIKGVRVRSARPLGVADSQTLSEQGLRNATEGAQPEGGGEAGLDSGSSGFLDQMVDSQRRARAKLLRLAAAAACVEEEALDGEDCAAECLPRQCRRGPFQVCVYGCASAFVDACVYEAAAIACKVSLAALLAPPTRGAPPTRSAASFFKKNKTERASSNGLASGAGAAAAAALRVRWILRSNERLTHFFCPAIASSLPGEARWALLERVFAGSLANAAVASSGGGCLHVWILEEPEQLPLPLQRRLALLMLGLQRKSLAVSASPSQAYRRTAAADSAGAPPRQRLQFPRAAGWVVLAREPARLAPVLVAHSAGVRFPLASPKELSALMPRAARAAAEAFWETTSEGEEEARKRRGLPNTPEAAQVEVCLRENEACEARGPPPLPAAGYFESLVCLSRGDPVVAASLAQRAARLGFPSREALDPDVCLLRRRRFGGDLAAARASPERLGEEEASGTETAPANGTDEAQPQPQRGRLSVEEAVEMRGSLPFGLQFLPWRAERLGGFKGPLPKLARALTKRGVSPKSYATRAFSSRRLVKEPPCKTTPS